MIKTDEGQEEAEPRALGTNSVKHKNPCSRKQVRRDREDGSDEETKVDLIRQTTGNTQKRKENQSRKLQVTRTSRKKSRGGEERGDPSMYPKHGSESS